MTRDMDEDIARAIAAMSSFGKGRELAVEVRCRSLDDLRTALGIIASPPDESSHTPYIPNRVFDIPVTVDPDMRPGEVRAFDAQGTLILHHLPRDAQKARPSEDERA